MFTKPHDIMIEKLAMESNARIQDFFDPPTEAVIHSEYIYRKGYLLALADIQKYLSGCVSKRIKMMLTPPDFRPLPEDVKKEYERLKEESK